jgi:hypothetical protein
MNIRIKCIYSLIALALYCDGRAKIGDKESEMSSELGKPISVTEEGFKVYKTGKLQTRAHFTGGICDNMVYEVSQDTPLNDHIVSVLLCVDSAGLAWIVDENSKPEMVMYNTPNNALHAILLSRSKLSIFTDEFLKHRKRETGQ